MKATKKSWKNEKMSKERELLSFEALYSDLDADKMMNGYLPKEMEDKWFIYFHKGRLYFHRSWTGYCIFMAKLDAFSTGMRMTEVWVTRDKLHYNSSGRESDLSIFSSLIESLLIEREQ